MVLAVIIGVILWHVLVILKWALVVAMFKSVIDEKVKPKKYDLPVTMDYVLWSAEVVKKYGIPATYIQERINKVAGELDPIRKVKK